MDIKQAEDEIEDVFLTHINADDPLQIVIRGHLHIEAHLNGLIARKFSNPDAIDFSDFSFPKKLDLAIALGLLDPESRPAYSSLNSLRNKLAHNLQHKVTARDVRDVQNTFSTILRKTYKRAAAKKPELKNDHIESLRWIIALLLTHLEIITNALDRQRQDQ